MLPWPSCGPDRSVGEWWAPDAEHRRRLLDRPGGTRRPVAPSSTSCWGTCALATPLVITRLDLVVSPAQVRTRPAAAGARTRHRHRYRRGRGHVRRVVRPRRAEARADRCEDRDGLAAARARGRTGGGRPELSPSQARHDQELYDGRQQTVQQIADVLRIPRSTVYGNLGKALPAAGPGRAARPRSSGGS